MIHKLKIKKILFFVTLIIILSELILRVSESIWIKGNVDTLYNYVKFFKGELSWHIQPSITVVQTERYGDRIYSFNNYGYRGKDFSLTSNRNKILFLGDSITFGLGVNNQFTYPSIIEDRLKISNNTKNFVTNNLALFAYSPSEELFILKNLGLKLQPNMIILQIYMNDFYKIQEEELDFSVSTQPSSSFIQRFSLQQRFHILKEAIITNSAILRRIRQGYSMLAYTLFHDIRREYFPTTLNDEVPKSMKELFMSHSVNTDIKGFEEIEEMYNLTKKQNIDFLVILIPNEVQLFTGDYDIINEKINKFFEDKGIPFFDTLNDMSSLSDKAYLFLDGLHLSERGHQFVASWLLPIIEKRLSLKLENRLFPIPYEAPQPNL